MLNWIKNHIKATTAIVVFSVTIIISGIVMLSSKVDYDNYLKEYEINTLAQKANSPIDPLSVSFEDDYASLASDGKALSSKSSHSSIFTAYASDFEVTSSATDVSTDEGYLAGSFVTGDRASFTFTLEKNSYADFEVVMASSKKASGLYVETKELFENFSIFVNSHDIFADLDLGLDDGADGSEPVFHQLVVAEVAFPAGENVIEFVCKNNNVMPFIQSFNLFTDVKASLK